MARDFEAQRVKGVDDDPFTKDEIAVLAKLHSLASWPVLQSALLRYQARAYTIITSMSSTIEAIRVAQGRIDMAQQLLDLVEEEAPTRYKREQKQDANDS